MDHFRHPFKRIQRLSVDPISVIDSDRLTKLISVRLQTGYTEKIILDIDRTLTERAEQSTALNGGVIRPPNSLVNFSDRLETGRPKTSSTLSIIDAEVYDLQRRCNLEHRFIRHDLIFSEALYKAVYSLLLVEWGIGREFDPKRMFNKSEQYVCMLLGDFKSSEIQSNRPNPVKADRPGTGDIRLQSLPIRLITLIQVTNKDDLSPISECVRLLDRFQSSD